jgi:hypothetical protein
MWKMLSTIIFPDCEFYIDRQTWMRQIYVFHNCQRSGAGDKVCNSHMYRIFLKLLFSFVPGTITLLKDAGILIDFLGKVAREREFTTIIAITDSAHWAPAGTMLVIWEKAGGTFLDVLLVK